MTDYERHTYPFLTALAGTADLQLAKFTFQTYDDAGRGRKDLVSLRHGTIYEHQEALRRLNGREAAIHVTISQTDGRGRTKCNVTHIRAWYCDIDSKTAKVYFDSAKLPLEPSMVVKTPGGWHIYWLATLPYEPCDALRRAAFESELRGIIHNLKDVGADPACSDCVRVLRLPGFNHCKGEPTLVTLDRISDARYTAADIRRAFPAPAPKPTPRAAIKPQRGPQDASDRLGRAARYIDRLPPAVSGRGGHRATFVAALKAQTVCGLNQDEAFGVLVQSFNSRCQPPWSEAELRRKVTEAARAAAGGVL